MRAGRLRHYVTVRKKTQSNKWNAIKPTWINIANVWASIEPLRGKQFFAADQNNNKVTNRIIIRYIPNLTSDMEIHYKNRRFRIEVIMDLDERTKTIEIHASEMKGTL